MLSQHCFLVVIVLQCYIFRHSTDFLFQTFCLHKALFKSQSHAKCGMSREYGRQTVIEGFCLSDCVLQDFMLLWTTSWVLRSFIAALMLFLFLRYNCLFNLPVVWEMVVSSETQETKSQQDAYISKAWYFGVFQ